MVGMGSEQVDGLAKVDFDLEAARGVAESSAHCGNRAWYRGRISEVVGGSALAAKLRSGLHTRYPERRCLAEGFR